MTNYDLCEKYRYQDITLITPIGSTNYDNFPWNLFKSPTKTVLSDNSPSLDTDVYIKSYLSYRRNNMKSGSYATFCLPFSIDLNDAEDYFEAIYCINGSAFYKTDNGKLILMLKNIDKTDSIPAEYPFIVKLKDTVNEVCFYNKNLVVIDELTNPAPIQLQVYNWNGKNGLLKENTSLNVCFGGSLVTMTDKGSNYETFNTDGSFGPTNNGIVKAFRAYVIKGNAASINNIQSISLGFDDSDETSNIEFAIETNKPVDKSIYSIDGQIIEHGNLNKGLRPGLYIKNGHKILTK